MTRGEELAWAAGFIEGEGCIDYIPRNPRRKPRLRVRVSNTEPKYIHRLDEVFDGALVKPRPPRSLRNKPYWAYTLNGSKAEKALAELRPYMTAHSGKLERTEKWMRERDNAT